MKFRIDKGVYAWFIRTPFGTVRIYKPSWCWRFEQNYWKDLFLCR